MTPVALMLACPYSECDYSCTEEYARDHLRFEDVTDERVWATHLRELPEGEYQCPECRTVGYWPEKEPCDG